MILLTSQLPYQQPNQLKPDTFNLSQEFLACVCSRRQSLRGRNLEDSRGVKRRGGLWLEASGGHTLLILKVWFSMQEVYATKSQIFRVYCYRIHLTLLRSLKPKQHIWSWITLAGLLNAYRKDRHGKRGGGVLLAVKSHLTCLRRRDLETEVEMLACVIHTSLSPLFVFYCRCFIVLLSLMSSFLSSSRNSYKDIHPQNCLMSFSWAILIFHKSTGLMAYKYIYLYFYLHLYNINIRKSDDWNLRRPSKR